MVAVSGKAASAGRSALELTSVDESDETDAWEPVVLWAPSGSDLDAFAGSYASEELDTVWRLSAENGKLFIRHRGFPEDPLAPTVQNVFSLEGMTLHFLRGAGGAVTGFTLDDGRVRGIAFERQKPSR
jgi:hypothetical protein